jgi:hypothetical protein
MSAFTLKGGIFTVALALIFASAASAVDWKEFAEGTTGAFLYDPASVRSTPQGLTRAWIHNEKVHETSLVEFDCQKKAYRVLDVVQYDEGQQIRNRSDYYDNPGWLEIREQSVLDPLRELVCR